MRFFFNNTLRSYDIAMGTMFNDIWVIHYDKNNPKDIKEIKVPLVYDPKLHWYLRKYDNIPNNFNIKTTLPRISFSRSAPQYDSKRQLNKNTIIKGNKQYSPEVENYIQKWAGTAAPYKIPYELNIWTHTMNEMNQILEQILSYFQTQTYNLFVNECPMFDVGRNCKVTIENTSANYNSDFDIKGDRLLRHKINLSIEGNIYSVIKEDYVIKEIVVNYLEVEYKQNEQLENTTDSTCVCEGGYDENGNSIPSTSNMSTQVITEEGSCQHTSS